MKIFGMVTTAGSKQFTELALKTFFKTTVLAGGDRFFLIDNDGGMKSDDFSEYPIERITNKTSLGFAENANQMITIALADGADLFFLNNDLIFTKDWIEALLIDEPVILSPFTNREAQYSSTVAQDEAGNVLDQFTCRMTMELEDYLGHEKALDLIVEKHRRSVKGYLDVLTLPFCCVKLPLEVLKGVGYFDTLFGKGGAEDYDYAMRAYLGGFSVKYAFQSFVLHFGGKASWSGGESRDVTIEREKKFRQVFQAKWGRKLYDVIISEIDSILLENRSVKEMIRERNLRGVVVELLEGRQIAVKI